MLAFKIVESLQCILKHVLNISAQDLNKNLKEIKMHSRYCKGNM